MIAWAERVEALSSSKTTTEPQVVQPPQSLPSLEGWNPSEGPHGPEPTFKISADSMKKYTLVFLKRSKIILCAVINNAKMLLTMSGNFME